LKLAFSNCSVARKLQNFDVTCSGETVFAGVDAAPVAPTPAGTPLEDAATGVCIEQVIDSGAVVLLSKLQELITFTVTMSCDVVVSACPRGIVAPVANSRLHANRRQPRRRCCEVMMINS
jgi:hypothetical protein